MMVSTKGRYALRVMIDLAEHDDGRFIPLKEIAARQGISEKYLESIVKLLARSGDLFGMRGKGGGYRLTRAPEEYTVGSILRLTEGGLVPVNCQGLSEEGQCGRSADCPTFPLWKGLEDVINQYLDSITLAELLRRRKKRRASVRIRTEALKSEQRAARKRASAPARCRQGRSHWATMTRMRPPWFSARSYQPVRDRPSSWTRSRVDRK